MEFCRDIFKAGPKPYSLLVDPGATFAPGVGGNVVQKWGR